MSSVAHHFTATHNSDSNSGSTSGDDTSSDRCDSAGADVLAHVDVVDTAHAIFRHRSLAALLAATADTSEGCDDSSSCGDGCALGEQRCDSFRSRVRETADGVNTCVAAVTAPFSSHLTAILAQIHAYLNTAGVDGASAATTRASSTSSTSSASSTPAAVYSHSHPWSQGAGARGWRSVPFDVRGDAADVCAFAHERALGTAVALCGSLEAMGVDSNNDDDDDDDGDVVGGDDGRTSTGAADAEDGDGNEAGAVAQQADSGPEKPSGAAGVSHKWLAAARACLLARIAHTTAQLYVTS